VYLCVYYSSNAYSQANSLLRIPSTVSTLLYIPKRSDPTSMTLPIPSSIYIHICEYGYETPSVCCGPLCSWDIPEPENRTEHPMAAATVSPRLSPSPPVTVAASWRRPPRAARVFCVQRRWQQRQQRRVGTANQRRAGDIQREKERNFVGVAVVRRDVEGNPVPHLYEATDRQTGRVPLQPLYPSRRRGGTVGIDIV